MCEDNGKKELMEFINEVMTKEHSESHLISVLHKVQKSKGYLCREDLEFVSEQMGIPTSHIWGVATFYHYFRLKPAGKHTVSVCMGTACFVKGAALVLEAIRNELRIEIGETTSDGLFSFIETRCLGACGLAPLVMIDDRMYGNMTSSEVVKLIKGIKKGIKA